jgi:hypothetical protein
MPLIYKIYAEEHVAADASPRWAKFDSDTVWPFWYTKAGKVIGQPTKGGDSLKNEILAGHTLAAVIAHKRFHAQMAPEDISIHALHYLLAAVQQAWKLKMTLELVRFDQKSGKQAGHTVVSEQFVATAISSLMLAKDGFAFNFNIIGGVNQTNYDD